MPRIHPLVGSFNAGELTPRLAARTDFAKYPAGLETCVNLIPLAEGGLMRRAGTRYVAEEKSSSVKGRLYPFQFSDIDSHALEFGDGVIRFYRHQGQIVAADTDASISNGTFTSNINDWDDVSTGSGSIAHDSTNGRLSLDPGGTGGTDIGWAEQDVSVGAAYDTNVHVLKFRVIGAPSDRIELRIGTSTGDNSIVDDVEFEVGYHCHSFTPGDGNNTIYIQFRNRGDFRDKVVQIDDVSLIDDGPVEIDAPWAEADLYDISGSQSANFLYVFHKTTPTHRLVRNGLRSWSLIEVAWVDGPWLDENVTATTLTPSAATGLGINLTLSSTVGVNDDQGWLSTDVGRLVRYKKSSSYGYAVITSITSTTVAVADVREDFEASPTAQTTWRLGAWSGTTGYPRASAFFEQRLYAAGTTDQPQTFWASQTADFENFRPDDKAGTVEDDDALDFTLSADDVSAIRWLSAGEDTLAIGTLGGEWVPQSQGAVLTPSDITVRRQTTYGCANVRPLRVGSTVLFVQRARRKVREFGFAFESDGFVAPDMTRLAYHLTQGGIVEMAYQQEPDSLVWAVRDDGVLLSMTFRRDEDVVGWSRHIMGGELYGSMTKVLHYDDSAETYTEETTDANSATDADWTVFPSSEAVDDFVAIGHTEPFGKLVVDYANGTAGIGGAVTWEYWDGSAWTEVSGLSDGTSGFTATAADDKAVTWTIPTDWSARVLDAGRPLYYVRARVTTVYSTNPVLDQGFIPGKPKVESVITIPGADGSGQIQNSEDRDEVWLMVRRTINGATRRYVELLERDFEDGHAQEDAYYADSLITYDGAAATAITGLDHLEGATVGVWGDGAVLPDETVVSGQITLDSAVSVAQIGLRYRHDMKTLKFEGGNQAGSAVGKTKRIHGVTFVVLNSHTTKYGPTAANLTAIDFRQVADEMDEAVPLYTGERFEEFDGDWETDARIVLRSDDPAPFHLLGLAPEISLHALK